MVMTACIYKYILHAKPAACRDTAKSGVILNGDPLDQVHHSQETGSEGEGKREGWPGRSRGIAQNTEWYGLENQIR